MNKLLRNAGITFTGLALLFCGAACGERVGQVDTAVKWFTPDDGIEVEAFDDPKVEGVTCYVSRAYRGGVKGTLGLAEDSSDAAIACRQIGPIRFKEPLEQQEDAFTQRISLVFKKLHVVRMVDAKRQTLVYLSYSDKLIDGSPKNSVSAVPVGADIPMK